MPTALLRCRPVLSILLKRTKGISRSGNGIYFYAEHDANVRLSHPLQNFHSSSRTSTEKSGGADTGGTAPPRSSALEAIRRAGLSGLGVEPKRHSQTRGRRGRGPPSAAALEVKERRRKILGRRLFDDPDGNESGAIPSLPAPAPARKLSDRISGDEMPPTGTSMFLGNQRRRPANASIRQRRSAESLSRNVEAALEEAVNQGTAQRMVSDRTKIVRGSRGNGDPSNVVPLCLAEVDGEPVEISGVDVSTDLRDATVRWSLPFSADQYDLRRRSELAREIHSSLRGRGGMWIKSHLAGKLRSRKFVTRLHFEWDEADEMEEQLANGQLGDGWWRGKGWDNTRRRRIMREMGVILPKEDYQDGIDVFLNNDGIKSD